MAATVAWQLFIEVDTGLGVGLASPFGAVLVAMQAALPTPELLHPVAHASGPLGIAIVATTGLVRLAKASVPHVTALLLQRQRLRASQALANDHPDHRIEITPSRIVVIPKDGPGHGSSRGTDVASPGARHDQTNRHRIETKTQLAPMEQRS